MANTIACHPPGVTYNGLHATTTPSSPQVTDDLTLTKAHFGFLRTYYPQYNGGAVDVGQIAYGLGLKVLNSFSCSTVTLTGSKTTIFNSLSRP